MPDAAFDLKELCDRARVTPRTVHFYVQQGLLPPAGAPGPGARYGDGHVARLRLIRLLQREHLPLAEIGRRIKGLTDLEVEALVDEARGRRDATPGSALDYIRGVLSGEAAPRPPSASVGSPPPPVAMTREVLNGMEALRTPPPPPTLDRSQWERFTVVDGVELHVRRPMPRLQQRRLERLLAAAREIFDPQEE